MLTIILTTKNNSNLIKRQLKYYVLKGLKYKIIISDASNDNHHKINKKIINNYKKKLKIDYYWHENYSVKESHLFLITKLKTKFSVCVADGAFLVPSALEQCINFLLKNQEYVSVQGKVYTFTLKNNTKVYGDVLSFFENKPKLSYSSNLIERLNYTSSNYSNCLYSVMHSSVWKEMWSESKNINFHWVSSEILPAILLVLMGKIGEINKTYLFRHAHNKRTVVDNYNNNQNDIKIDMIRWSGSMEVWNEFNFKFKKILKKKIIKYNNNFSEVNLNSKLEIICNNLFFKNNRKIRKNNFNFITIFFKRIYLIFTNLIINIIDKERNDLKKYLLENQSKIN